MRQELAEVGEFCLNEACEDYGQVDEDSIVRFGQTESGVQRYRCKTCGKTFVATKGALSGEF